VSKVERPIALKNLDEIIEESDCIMVARGDLGVEIPPQEVPSWQKDMITRCNKEGKVVICATQMLESMTGTSRPTRAEASDVFNAVLDGADAVMLSGETAVGKYPVEAVKYMDTINASAEKFMQTLLPKPAHYYDSKKPSITQAVGHSASIIADEFKRNQYTGKLLVLAGECNDVLNISKYRPEVPILAFTNDLRIARELNLVWGTRSIYEEVTGADIEERARVAIQRACDVKLLKDTDHVIVATSTGNKNSGLWVGVYDVKDIKRI